MGLKGSVLIANPISAQFEVSEDEIEKHIQQALNDAQLKQINGKELTPFLLKHIAEYTKGESLDANIALVLNNARLAALIAVELQKINWHYGNLAESADTI